MLNFLKNTVLKPGLERVGTIAAAWLVFQGDKLCALYDACGVLTPSFANTVVEVATVGILLGVDLVVIHTNRKNQK